MARLKWVQPQRRAVGIGSSGPFGFGEEHDVIDRCLDPSAPPSDLSRLAFALSWWAWPWYVLDLSPTPFFACGPLVAALVVIAMTEGWSGYRTLGARMIHWRVGWRWWIVGLGMPLAVLVVAALANIAIWDAPTPVLADLAWPTLALVFAVRFVNPLDGPLGEEPGWRGYALPQLQTGRAPLGAAFILGLFMALWHVPLVMTGQLAETQHPQWSTSSTAAVRAGTVLLGPQ